MSKYNREEMYLISAYSARVLKHARMVAKGKIAATQEQKEACKIFLAAEGFRTKAIQKYKGDTSIRGIPKNVEEAAGIVCDMVK